MVFRVSQRIRLYQRTVEDTCKRGLNCMLNSGYSLIDWDGFTELIGQDRSEVDSALWDGDDSRIRPDDIIGYADLAGLPSRFPVPAHNLRIRSDHGPFGSPDDGYRCGSGLGANECPKYKRNGLHGLGLFHRAFAAFAAIWDRLRGPSAAALAAPPFKPPRRPKATACGFFDGSTGFSFGPGSVFGACPVASRMIWKARALGSFGRGSRFFDRSGMMLSVWQGGGRSQPCGNPN